MNLLYPLGRDPGLKVWHSLMILSITQSRVEFAAWLAQCCNKFLYPLLLGFFAFLPGLAFLKYSWKGSMCEGMLEAKGIPKQPLGRSCCLGISSQFLSSVFIFPASPSGNSLLFSHLRCWAWLLWRWWSWLAEWWAAAEDSSFCCFKILSKVLLHHILVLSWIDDFSSSLVFRSLLPLGGG